MIKPSPYKHRYVRRQSFWNQSWLKLRESSAHLLFALCSALSVMQVSRFGCKVFLKEFQSVLFCLTFFQTSVCVYYQNSITAILGLFKHLDCRPISLSR